MRENTELVRRAIIYTEHWLKTGDESARLWALYWYLMAETSREVALRQVKIG